MRASCWRSSATSVLTGDVSTWMNRENAVTCTYSTRCHTSIFLQTLNRRKTTNSLSQDKRIPRIATGPLRVRQQLIFTVQASVQCQDTVFLVDEVALRNVFLRVHRFPTPRRYHYSDVVLGLTWSKDPDRYTCGSVAAGRISHTDSSNAMTLVPLARGWPLGPISTRKNTFMSRKSHKRVGWDWYGRRSGCKEINPLAPKLFFLISAHSVYKMWIIQEPNKLTLWNKLHFEEKKRRV